MIKVVLTLPAPQIQLATPPRAQLLQELVLGQLLPLLKLPAVPVALAAATTETQEAPAGPRSPLHRGTVTNVLLILRAHFGHPEGFILLGEAVDHQMTQMVVVGEAVVAAAKAVALEGALSPATPTTSGSL